MATARRLAAFGLPAVPLPGFDSSVESPTLGVVDGAARVPPELSALAAVVALPLLYAGHRLLRARFSARSRTWYALGLGIAGLATAVVAVGGWLGAPAFALAIGVNLAAVGAAAAFLPALLTMPGPLTTVWVRIRRALDGAIVGLCLMFCARILVLRPYPHLDTPSYWLIMFHCCVLATAVLAGVRPRTARLGPALCAGGVAAATVGLSALAFAIAHDAPLALVAAILALLATAPLLVWRGVGELPASSPAMVPRAPLIAVPAALALGVALHQLATGGELDRDTVMLGTLAVLAVGVRRLIGTTTAAMRVRASAPSRIPVPVGAPVPASVAGRTRPAAFGSAAVPGPAGAAAAAGPAGVPSGGALAAALATVGIAPVIGPAPVIVPVPRSREGIHGGDGTDPVTGLATRTRVLSGIAAMRCAPRSPGALLVIGVDGLPPALDRARDAVLREVGRRLTGLASPATGDRTAAQDLPARITASEFALLTGANLAHAYGLAERVVAVLAEPVPLGEQTLRLSACVGLTDLAGAASTEDAVLRANLALRRARQLGPGRVEWYDSEVAAAVVRRQVLERELPGAVKRGELDLIYQPIMDLERDRPLAVEALLRWRHPQLGTLMPADVIPLAEATGAIVEVGHWVLRKATTQLASWRSEGRDLSMAINVSPHQLGTNELTAEVKAALAAYDLPPERVVLEVAESAIEDGAELHEYVAALRSVGVRTALDEFGASAASLAHLRTLPIDMVKIGQPLFGSAESPLIGVMVGVGRRLGIDVVAQGVEAPAQLALVRGAGCRLGQGHLFSRPLPAEHTEAYLDGFGPRGLD